VSTGFRKFASGCSGILDLVRTANSPHLYGVVPPTTRGNLPFSGTFD
jgi:hypothetical protein